MYIHVLISVPIFITEVKLAKPLDNCFKVTGLTMKNYRFSYVKICF